jgi:hypothetical protein
MAISLQFIQRGATEQSSWLVAFSCIGRQTVIAAINLQCGGVMHGGKGAKRFIVTKVEERTYMREAWYWPHT